MILTTEQVDHDSTIFPRLYFCGLCYAAGGVPRDAGLMHHSSMYNWFNEFILLSIAYQHFDYVLYSSSKHLSTWQTLHHSRVNREVTVLLSASGQRPFFSLSE